jgi:beta-lactamase class A
MHTTMGRRRLFTGPALVVALAIALPGALAGARVRDGVHPWRPHISAAEHFVGSRSGTVGFAVATLGHRWGRGDRVQFHSASVVKAMLLVAYLRQVGDHPLSSDDRNVLRPMIQRSDNDAASRIYERVGDEGLRRLARRVGMRRFSPGGPTWGLSRIDAQDQAHFFLRIDRYMPRRHRAFGMHLLATVIPEQRWGVGRVRPRGWRLYFKGGWGSGSGLVDHQVALLRRGHQRVAVAVLTADDPDHEYGKRTLQGVFGRLFRGLARSRIVR